MSIEEQHIDTTSARGNASALAHAAQQPVAALSWWRHRLLSPLWLCLLAALLVRIWLVVHTNGVINGDEALVGIQAQHILRGEFPVYYYGQPYMGSLEAYLMALIFAVAGSSVWTLRAEPILLSLVIVWLTWRLAAALADAAHLPAYAKTTFQTIAAICAAVPPLYDTVQELRTLGGYVETFIIMLLLLLAALRLTQRWQAGASHKELALRWLGIGFIIGLGFWVDPLVISAVLAVALWILVFFVASLFQVRHKVASERRSALFSHVGNLLLGAATIPGFLLGAAPALYWGATNQWANLQYILQLSSSTTFNQRLALFGKLFQLYTTSVAPRIIGGSLPIENSALALFSTLLLDIGILVIGITVVLTVLSLFWRQQTLVRLRRLVALPLLFGVFSALIFCTSSTSAAGLHTPQYDLTGRYATPLMLALPFFFAALTAIFSIFCHELKELQPRAAAEKQETSLAPASLAPGKDERAGISVMLQVILFGAIAFYLLGLAYSTGLADPAYTFQSPSCPIAPANDAPIIAYLQQQHVHYAWALTWLGYPIIFQTNENIIVADPRLVANNNPAQTPTDRTPAYLSAVLHADRPAILAFVPHNDANPTLLQTLDSMGITYQVKRFPSEAGAPAQPGTKAQLAVDVLVVTSLSRPLIIKPTGTFRYIFRNCV
ncbi:MAG TPA: hypothetical protein VNE61_15730 [Ktedonobacteraceae bacterium]|nr:hypothetical protein [Ktedonobacteraceae bacterium]